LEEGDGTVSVLFKAITPSRSNADVVNDLTLLVERRQRDLEVADLLACDRTLRAASRLAVPAQVGLCVCGFWGWASNAPSSYAPTTAWTMSLLFLGAGVAQGLACFAVASVLSYLRDIRDAVQPGSRSAPRGETP
jgi:hypothetical protein